MKSVELERTLDKIEYMLDNDRLSPKDESILIEVRTVIINHIEQGVFQSKELEKAIKKYKRVLSFNYLNLYVGVLKHHLEN